MATDAPQRKHLLLGSGMAERGTWVDDTILELVLARTTAFIN